MNAGSIQPSTLRIPRMRNYNTVIREREKKEKKEKKKKKEDTIALRKFSIGRSGYPDLLKRHDIITRVFIAQRPEQVEFYP